MTDGSRGEPWAFSPGTIPRILDRAASRAPGSVAFLAPGRTPLTYGALREHVARTAGELRALGIGRSDRVALALPNGPEMAAAFLSVVSAGACAPLNPTLIEAEAESALAQLRVETLLVLEGDRPPALEAARRLGIVVRTLSPVRDGAAGLFTLRDEGESPHAGPGRAADEPRPDDVALVLQTSGTTARPKVVPLTQANVAAAAAAIARALELTPADVCLNVMPLFHIHGLSTVYASLAAGARVALPPAFDPADLPAWLEELRPTWWTAAPTIHRAILEVAQRHPEPFASTPIRFVRSASAAMPVPLLTEIEKVLRVPFIEAYGMSEASPQVSSNPLPPGERRPGSVGRAAGAEIAILDASGRPAAPGDSGEVAVRGPNVMAAYEDDDAANAAAFADGWFRTGDEGRLDGDGYLFITGRLKEVINRGGEKISPREVDEALLAHPAVAQAIAFPVPHFRLGEDVAAAVVLHPGASAGERPLREFVAARLSDFKVPSRILIVKELPQAATAKVRRIGLAERLGLTKEEPDVSFELPRTPAEEVLAAIWGQVLRIDRVGIHDSFFRLGGDSILALRVISQLKRTLGVTVPVQSFFAGPTIAAMSRELERVRTKGSDDGAIPRLPPGAEAPPSFVQMGLWFLDQLDPANPSYNVYRGARLSGPLDAGALERALGEIARRHEILRTSFVAGHDGRPRRVVRERANLPLAVVDLTDRPAAEREDLAHRLACEEAGRPFDLAVAPLMRATLLRLGAEEHVLVVAAHHIVIDLWSIGILFHELSTLYEAYLAGSPSPLGEPPIQQSDFAAWQHGQSELFARQLTYWKAQLGGAPEIELATDRPREAATGSRGARLFVTLPGALARGVKTLARKEGATLFMTLLAAFKALLSRRSGQSDIVIGSPIAYRNRTETEATIGIFSNTLVLRTDLGGDPTFRELLGRVRAVALAAYVHQDVPFENLVDGVSPAKHRATMPLFQVNFRVQNDPSATVVFPGLATRFLKLENGRSKFDLAFELFETADGLGGFWEYRTELFDASTIERLAARFESLLTAAVADPDLPISRLPFGDELERGRPRTLGEARRRGVALEDPPA